MPQIAKLTYTPLTVSSILCRLHVFSKSGVLSIATQRSYSGFPSERINLSPFTKDFRGGEQLNESFVICLWLASASLIMHLNVSKKRNLDFFSLK